MKKTLTALAVLGAFAGSALATDITLYGVVDLGLQYQNEKLEGTFSEPGFRGSEEIKSDTWGLESGSNSGSRWGIKGSEQISENLTVGFQLEQGFNTDAGDYADDDRFFNRESRLYVQTPFGEVGMGRMGALDSGLGSYDLMEAASAFGTGWGTIGASPTILRGMGDRMDNTITYKSPQFGGVTVLAQVSLSPASDGREASSDSDRYYALGAKGQWNAFEAALVASTTDYDRRLAGGPLPSNSKVVTGYVTYDCGFAKTTLSAQYYDDMRKSLVDFNRDDNNPVIDLMNILPSKGYGVMLSTTAALAGGEFLASVGYADYESTLDSNSFFDTHKADAFNVGIGYQYPLSKRTFVYAGAGYTKVSNDLTEGRAKVSFDDKTIEVVSGLVHTF